MTTSSFQKLLTQASPCVELSSNKITSGTIDWETARDQASAYREYIDNLPIESTQKISSYVLTEEDIKILLAQDTGKIKAMRIYLGHEKVKNVGEEKADDSLVIKLYIVGCALNSVTKEYDDFNLPEELQQDPPSAILSEVRPCPTNCGLRNFMNHS